MSMSRSQILDRLPEPIRREPKKSAVLAGLALMMAVLFARQFGGSGAPAKARGAAVAETQLSAGRSPAKPDAISRTAGNAQVEAARRVAQWLGTPIKPLDRNLFQTKLEYFQRLDSALSDKASVVADELFWEQLAKSLASQADQKKQKQIRSDNLQLAASSLRLQTTIMGSSPRALVDGRMVRTGDVVDATASGLKMSFRVLQIDARRIVIEREGVKLELRMGIDKARVVQE